MANVLNYSDDIYPEEAISLGRTTLAIVFHGLLRARLISNAPSDDCNPSLGALLLHGIKNTWQTKTLPPELAPVFNKALPASGELDWETVQQVTRLPSVQPILDAAIARHPALKPSVRLARKLKLLSRFSGTDLRPEAFDISVIDTLYGVEDHLMGITDSIAALRDELTREIKAVKKAVQAGKAVEGECGSRSSAMQEPDQLDAISVGISSYKPTPEKLATKEYSPLPEHEDNRADGFISSNGSSVKKRKAEVPPEVDRDGKKIKLHQ